MLIRKQCEKGLQFLKEHAMELVDDEDMEGNIVYDYYNFSEEDLREYVEPLEKLISEHFDNPPLKFEELKESFLVWDNELKLYAFVLDNYKPILLNVSTSSNLQAVSLQYRGGNIECLLSEKVEETINDYYTPNRFYRKEIKNGN